MLTESSIHLIYSICCTVVCRIFSNIFNCCWILVTLFNSAPEMPNLPHHVVGIIAKPFGLLENLFRVTYTASHVDGTHISMSLGNISHSACAPCCLPPPLLLAGCRGTSSWMLWNWKLPSQWHLFSVCGVMKFGNSGFAFQRQTRGQLVSIIAALNYCQLTHSFRFSFVYNYINIAKYFAGIEQHYFQTRRFLLFLLL